ncbi:MAG: phnA protein [Verrucomicrobiaceae bacterium]
MAKGFNENQERLALLNSFGKDLARRAKSTCELSLKSGVPLRIYEVPPVPKEPDFERCLMLSDEVIAALEKPSLFQADEWRHLGELIWTDQPLQQVMVVRVLQYLGKTNPWCQEIVEEAYLDEEVLAAAEAVPLG